LIHEGQPRPTIAPSPVRQADAAARHRIRWGLLRCDYEVVFEYVGPPLTRARLAEVLAANNVSERAYDLSGAHKHDAVVLDDRPEGWVVFYSERGGENVLARYETEADACSDLLTRLLRDEHNRFDLVAGPAPPDDADAAFASWLDDHDLTLGDLARDELRMQDSPWVAGQPDYRRYFVHRKRLHGSR
jgi:hypothetical protein